MVFALIGSALASSSLADETAAKVGERHVELTLPDIHTGKPVSLSEFRGKKVLLIQFAAW